MIYHYDPTTDYMLQGSITPLRNDEGETFEFKALEGCLSMCVIYVVFFLIFFAGCLLLSSCGSFKKVTKESTEQTSRITATTDSIGMSILQSSSQASTDSSHSVLTLTDDSTETVTVRETIWYDTSKSDSNGVSPVLRTERLTAITHHGRKGRQEQNGNSKSSENSEGTLTTTSQGHKEESAENTTRSQTNKDVQATETKQLQYTAWLLGGCALLILSGILAYWVFSKYRQRG